MENLIKNIRVDLVPTPQVEELCNIISNPFYLSHQLAAFHSIMTGLRINRSVFVSQAVLDLSKHMVYDS